MIQTETLQISLSGEAAAQVREALESGEYDSASDVVADALKNWHRATGVEDVAHLRAAWEEAVRDDGPGLDAEPVFEAVRARLAARISERTDSCG